MLMFSCSSTICWKYSLLYCIAFTVYWLFMWALNFVYFGLLVLFHLFIFVSSFTNTQSDWSQVVSVLHFSSSILCWLFWVFSLSIETWKQLLNIHKKKLVGILVRIALNQQINLGRVDIFTILCLPIHEHGLSLPLHLFFDFFHQSLVVFFI